MNYLHRYFKENIFSIASAAGIPSHERLDRTLRDTEQYFLTWEGGCLMGKVAMEVIDSAPDLREIIRQFFNDWIKSLTTIFEDKYPHDVAYAMAELAVKEIQGATVLQCVYRNGDAVTVTMKRIKQSFIEN